MASIPAARVVLVALALLVPVTAEAQVGLSVDASGTQASFGRVTPGQPQLFGYATQLTVRASSPYSLLADVPGDFTTSVAPIKRMPIGRLQWRLHQFGGAFTAFLSGSQVILGAQPPTPPEGEAVVLDLRLAPDFSDPPTDPDGSDPYRAGITYTITAGTIDQSFAWPNPFSPDGDGASDRTEIHWFQDVPRVVDVLIYDDDGTTLVRTLTIARSIGTGEQVIEWDGRDEDRLIVAEGDYEYRVRVNPSQAVEPGLPLVSGLIGVERGIGAGTAVVTGRVRSSEGLVPLAGATVELFRTGGLRAGSAVSDGAGVYSITGVGAGTFYLATRGIPLHEDYRSPTFEVIDGTTVRMDLVIPHNNSLTIVKTADTTDADPGDLVGYRITVTASGVEDVTELVVSDQLPAGLRYVPGSLRRLVTGGEPRRLDDPPAGRAGHSLAIPLGTLREGDSVELYYEALVELGTRPGPLSNTASATGRALGDPVSAGPSSARIFVHSGDLGERSLLLGRVFLDVNDNGVFDGRDQPLPNSRVVLDDGTTATPDEEGRYSVRGVKDGARAGMVVIDLSKGEGSGLVPNGPSRIALADVAYGVATRLDFPMTQAQLDAYPGAAKQEVALGISDTTLGLDLGSGALKAFGRLAGFAEWELNASYKLTAWLDTSHDPRDERRVGQDALFFQPETGDFSTVRPGVPDKIGLQLTAPWGSLLLGRTGTGLTTTDLINVTRGVFGVEARVRKKTWGVRTFAGLADGLAKQDVLASDGSTGPYVLSARPVVPSSERVIVEGRNEVGDATTRFTFRRDTDYTIDYASGQIFLSQPLAMQAPSGERFFLIVHYDFAPAGELPNAPTAGGRADWKLGEDLAVGLSAVVEDAEPAIAAAAGLDGTYKTERLEVLSEVAISSRGAAIADELANDDSTAARLRTSVRPREDVSLFGYVSRVGGAYQPRVDFQTPTPSEQGFGYLPPPQQTIIGPSYARGLFNGGSQFPFTLQGSPDRFEWGAGTQYRPREDVSLSVGSFHVSNDVVSDDQVDGFANQTSYVAGSYRPKGYPSGFLAYTNTLLGALETTERAVLAGTQWSTEKFAAAVEFRHARRATDLEGTPDVTGNSALIRGRYVITKKLQPAALVQGSRDVDSTGARVGRAGMLALGVESQWKGWTGFSYASVRNVFDPSLGRAQTTLGGFGGVTFGMARLRGTTRFDLSRSDRDGFRWGLGGRLRFLLTKTIFSFSDLLYTSGNSFDPVPQWNNTVGLAYRPLLDPGYFVFLKVKDRSQPVGGTEVLERRRAQLVTGDYIVPIRMIASLGLRLAWKRVSTVAGGYVHSGMVGEQVTWRLARRLDLVAGMRLSRNSLVDSRLFGWTAGAGVRFQHGLRLLLGYNHASAGWVFEADDSIPGLFLHLTGVYGSAGAPAELPYE